MKKVLMLWCILLGLLLLAPEARAAEAEDISGKALVTGASGIGSVNPLFDGRTMESVKIRSGGTLTLENREGIGSLYLIFGQEYGEYTVTDEAAGEQRCFGTQGYLHEFLDLEKEFGYAPSRVTIAFQQGDARLAEVSAFSPGDVPDWVQKWLPPLEGETDLALFSTHGDDEQLFFAGMLPYYGQELGYHVQVVYMTGHRNMSVRRSHEMLDGLWAVGIRNYPVFGPFGDYNTGSKAEAYQKYRSKNISKEDILSFVVENVRRFRPKVAVGHDLEGEYGHGMHMIYAELLCQAVEIAGDPQQFPASAADYGTWDVPKTYLHLYPENKIWMDWDRHLESFGGMTAYEVTRDLGFPCHVSQQVYFRSYFSGKEKAADIGENSPCEFGLYRSTVGPDLRRDDFFENVTTYAQDALAEARLQQEIAEALAEEKQQELEVFQQQTEPTQLPPLQEPEEEARRLVAFPALTVGISAFILILCIFGIFCWKKGYEKYFEKN